MERTLNILMIEDNPADYKLITRHMQSQGIKAECRRVEQNDELRQSLEHGNWDLVLSDYSMPQLDFHESFTLIRQLSPDLPVVLVSGSVGEEQAVELLKLGVWDFVLKDNLTRLVPAIERALQESTDRRARLAAEVSLREGERRYRSIFDNSPIAIGISEIQSGLLFEINESWLRLFDYNRDEVIGRTVAELGLYIRIDERNEIIRIIEAQGKLVNHALQMRRKSGEILDLLYSAELVDLADMPYLQVMLTDVSEKNRAIATLLESEQHFRSLYDNMLEGFAPCRMIFADNGLATDFVYLDVNKAFVELTGLRDAVGKRVSEVIPGIRESNPDVLERYGRVALTGRAERFEAFVPPLEMWFSISAYSVERGCFIALFDNITPRKHAEAAQVATIELLHFCNEAGSSRELLQTVTLYFQRFTGCEAIGVRIRKGDDFPYFEARGFPREFILAENSLCIRDLQGELLRDNAGHPVLDCMCGNIICGRIEPSRPFFSSRGSFWTSCTSDLPAGATAADQQARICSRCNSEGYESVALIPLRLQGEIIGLFQFNDSRKGRFTPDKIALLEDLVSYVAIALAKLRTDDELRESSRFNQQIIDSAQEGVVVYGRDLRYQVWNPYMEQMFGLPAGEVIGKHPLELFPFLEKAGVIERLDKALSGQTPDSIDFHFHIPQSGSSGWCSDSSSPLRNANGEVIGVIATVSNLTERTHLEEQLRHSQKMEAFGQLAGGVAHDFNNILSVVMGYSSILKMETNLTSGQQDNLDQILAAAEKAAQLTKGLLAFSRKQTLAPKTVNLNDIVQHVQKFLVRVIGEDIHLKTILNEVDLPVNADSSQIEQVLINLATNARDAMQQGGLLTIETMLQEVDAVFAHIHGNGKAGRYAVITFADSGTGMSEEIRKKIFEPFFTTKETGKGTGLGMAIVYGIVKQHNGFINVYSEPGKGTTFRIYLPLVSRETAVPEEQTAPAPPRGGSETILVAEDEQAVRELVEKVLTEFGYEVLLAVDGKEAIARFTANRDRIQLILMDMIMPQLNGQAAAAEIRKLQPGIKILFTSGYTADFIRNRGVDEEGMELIMKPVQLLELLRKVREILDR